jgi:glycosyltransferase involved in cell wall biosynthesis
MKVCFWGNIAGALTGKTEGGGELQIAFIARALIAGGNEVVVIDYNIREDFVTPDGIKVMTIKGWHQGVRIIRTLKRLVFLYNALKEVKADIYYSRIRDFRHILPYMVSRKINSKFVLHMASDLDAWSFRMRLKNYYFAKSASLWWFVNGLFVEIVYPYLLKHADLVLVQHEGQKEILRQKNIKSSIFLNIIDVRQMPDCAGRIREDFVWVGWLDNRKGFPSFYELIEKAPMYTYKVIGSPRDNVGELYFNKLKDYKNVKLLGELSHSRTLHEISSSKALISTSPMEGFPNVFLEAWACGIPVYSLIVDPGSVIQKQKLGVIAGGDKVKLLEALNMHDNSEEFSCHARNYVEQYHALNSEKINEINKTFREIRDGKE